jgi:ribosomal protein S19
VLIDAAFSVDRSVIKKVAENILKSKYLIMQILRNWNAKAKVIPEIVGATGTIS